MVKAVIFDLYDTLITLYEMPLHFGTQIVLNTGVEEEKFQKPWSAIED